MISLRSAEQAMRAVLAEQSRRRAAKLGQQQGIGTATDYAVALSAGRYQRGVRHLELLMDVLDDAATHGGRRIIVEMPVRHGKSWSTSHYFPVSFLDRWPDRNIILCGYEGKFARSWGRKVRNTIDENPSALRVRLSSDSTAANEFTTTLGGGMLTAGVDGPITGRPAHLLVIDDPIKNWQDAQSLTKRDSIWEWWTGTAYPRLEPGASVVVTMARWHPDDFIGRLLEQSDRGEGDQWTRIRIPAIADVDDPLGRLPGEALWPERYNVEALKKIRDTVTPHVWAALYQQEPIVGAGNTFKREWLNRTMEMPAQSQIVRAVRTWDCASTADGGDWTVGMLVALLTDGRIVVLDVIRVRQGPGDVDRLIKSTASIDGPSVAIREEREGGSSGKAVTERRKSELVGYDYEGLSVTGAKETRWMGAAAAANAGNLWFIAGAPWLRALVAELSAVPQSANDDQADTLGAAHTYLKEPPVKRPTVRAVPISGF